MGSRVFISGAGIGLLALLLGGLIWLSKLSDRDQYAEELVFYCAAGIQRPVEAIIEDYKAYYEKTHGKSVHIEVHYAGSGTLLSRLQVPGAATSFWPGTNPTSSGDGSRERSANRSPSPP